jgi:hypothetical protein
MSADDMAAPVFTPDAAGIAPTVPHVRRLASRCFRLGRRVAEVSGPAVIVAKTGRASHARDGRRHAPTAALYSRNCIDSSSKPLPGEWSGGKMFPRKHFLPFSSTRLPSGLVKTNGPSSKRRARPPTSRFGQETRRKARARAVMTAPLVTAQTATNVNNRAER